MPERAIPPARPWYDLIVKTIALKGWSKTTLSERSGISRSTIDNWQRNPRKPQASAVNAVADALGIPRERAHELAGIIERGPQEPLIPPGLYRDLEQEVGKEDAAAVLELLAELRRRKRD